MFQHLCLGCRTRPSRNVIGRGTRVRSSAFVAAAHRPLLRCRPLFTRPGGYGILPEKIWGACRIRGNPLAFGADLFHVGGRCPGSLPLFTPCRIWELRAPRAGVWGCRLGRCRRGWRCRGALPSRSGCSLSPLIGHPGRDPVVPPPHRLRHTHLLLCAGRLVRASWRDTNFTLMQEETHLLYRREDEHGELSSVSPKLSRPIVTPSHDD